MTGTLSIVLIAVALSMDAFAVSVSSGIAIQRLKIRHALLIASFFGAFQAFMPVLGWLAGKWAKRLIESIDHWIAFGLLLLVGIKMIHEARQNNPSTFNPLKIHILFLLAISTSIDALAVGITLSFIEVRLIQPVLVIGLVTFTLSFLGTYIGNFFGHIFEKKLEIIGGLILILIGVNILISHLLKH